MSKIGVILTDMFEDAEYTDPVEALKKAGHELAHVGVRLEEGQTAKGKKKGTPVKIDKTIQDASLDKLDALLIPCSYSYDQLRGNREVVQFVMEFMKSGKPVYTTRLKSSL